MSETVTISRLGARGDGIAEDGTPVAGALPGERVAIRREGGRGVLEAVEAASPDRIEPFCPYYGRCGGCATQHIAREPYAAWKRGLLAQALSQAGLPVEPGALIDAHGDGRRRITLHVRERDGRAEAGLMAARSHDLVAIDHCPITVPALHPAPAIARALSAPLGHGRKPLDVAVTATEPGLDVDIRGHGPVAPGVRAVLVRLAEELRLARLSLHGDVVVERTPPSVPSGPARLYPPPGGFLQATAAGEAALTALVLDALPKKVRRAADLFAGCGPFSLAMARTCDVHAVEGEAAPLAGLDRAFRAQSGLHRLTHERRDLFRRPLLAHDLNAFDAVVLDPPRAGAQAQVHQLAESRVPLVVGVACDAGTFARDAATLVAGGYSLDAVTPVDQFRYSGHLEMVGVFRRTVERRKPGLRRPR
ncbi:putative RNA methyltransferase [Methylobacterium gregans]|uniref:23S rRNA (Uracil(1939)-C(5))-methyltransferase RlmD n=1 Tax=Methylobacterium gregans TaxID=374424 RepID=A0AA37MB58_9HYPH|nr:RNA methyltransferase [Methylobacterium gregans]MDQ0519392.1 23S rRNA (uracil1939-C5)-methyltransferase [Methylobacterium gregans]GJD78676.1 23S rRNA (uracil(1939)-C(5))-methyltransferase RlmD [Methylobacterium gregans]GLS52967.1 putative RNA methyltransferase [Methylobacterium gregans]